MREICAFVPPTPGYMPCTRDASHSGPCAHPIQFPESVAHECVTGSVRPYPQLLCSSCRGLSDPAKDLTLQDLVSRLNNR